MLYFPDKNELRKGVLCFPVVLNFQTFLYYYLNLSNLFMYHIEFYQLHCVDESFNPLLVVHNLFYNFPFDFYAASFVFHVSELR